MNVMLFSSTQCNFGSECAQIVVGRCHVLVYCLEASLGFSNEDQLEHCLAYQNAELQTFARPRCEGGIENIPIQHWECNSTTWLDENDTMTINHDGVQLRKGTKAWLRISATEMGNMLGLVTFRDQHIVT
jgi:hypothetical protein